LDDKFDFSEQKALGLKKELTRMQCKYYKVDLYLFLFIVPPIELYNQFMTIFIFQNFITECPFYFQLSMGGAQS